MTETNILKSNGKIFLTVSLHRYRQPYTHKSFSTSLKIILSLMLLSRASKRWRRQIYWNQMGKYPGRWVYTDIGNHTHIKASVSPLKKSLLLCLGLVKKWNHKVWLVLDRPIINSWCYERASGKPWKTITIAMWHFILQDFQTSLTSIATKL